jgi:hypothetical protein
MEVALAGRIQVGFCHPGRQWVAETMRIASEMTWRNLVYQ